jgi:hypothetical protein
VADRERDREREREGERRGERERERETERERERQRECVCVYGKVHTGELEDSRTCGRTERTLRIWRR